MFRINFHCPDWYTSFHLLKKSRIFSHNLWPVSAKLCVTFFCDPTSVETITPSILAFKAVFSELPLNILLAVMKAVSSEWTKLFAKMQQRGTQSIRINQSSPTNMECSLIFNYPLLKLSSIWEGGLWFAVLYS